MKNLQNEYDNFMNTYTSDFETTQKKYDDRMSFVGDSLVGAQDKDIKLYEDKQISLGELLKRRPDLAK